MVCVIVLRTIIGSAAHAQSSIGGCQVLPADNIWNTPIDEVPVLANSASMVTTIGATRGFHADFGAGTWEGGPIGIPFVVVAANPPAYPATFRWPNESDAGPYAVPLSAPIEGGSQSTGDRHAIGLDATRCLLYELYRAFPQPAAWTADSGAIFDLRSNALRPQTWTSADAAGLPILPGLVTYDEVASGEIRHALRFTAPQTRREFVWPARHYASSLTGSQYPRMGERFRLKASFDITPYPADVQVILRAMKRYGIMLADNGSAWYLSGAPDERWNNDRLRTLRQLRGSDFEAVDATVLRISEESGAARQPASGGGRGFDDDTQADLAIYRPWNGTWFVRLSSQAYAVGAQAQYQWGTDGDRPLTADFDGDRRTDLTVYRPGTGEWFVRQSSTGHDVNTHLRFQWGTIGDLPLAADFDGDGTTDLTAFRPATGEWWVRRSSESYSLDSATRETWGSAGDVPVVADFDGDGRTELTVFRPAAGQWLVRWSTDAYALASASTFEFGAPGDRPLAADFDGDGRTDLVIYRPPTGEWFIRYSSLAFAANSAGWFQWGFAGDLPVAADFDGDGRSDLVVFRPSTGHWFVRYSSLAYSVTSYGLFQWGFTGDVPLPDR